MAAFIVSNKTLEMRQHMRKILSVLACNWINCKWQYYWPKFNNLVCEYEIYAGYYREMQTKFSYALGAFLCIATEATIVLDGAQVGRRFDGHGGLSAGASSRLLFDYPESVRSDILDYLCTYPGVWIQTLNRVFLTGLLCDFPVTDAPLPLWCAVHEPLIFFSCSWFSNSNG